MQQMHIKILVFKGVIAHFIILAIHCWIYFIISCWIRLHSISFIPEIHFLFLSWDNELKKKPVLHAHAIQGGNNDKKVNSRHNLQNYGIWFWRLRYQIFLGKVSAAFDESKVHILWLRNPHRQDLVLKRLTCGLWQRGKCCYPEHFFH